MPFYSFEMVKGEEIIAVKLRVSLPDTRAAWPKIANIAKGISVPGCHVRVREQSGEMIILISAAAARRYADPALNSSEKMAEMKNSGSTRRIVSSASLMGSAVRRPQPPFCVSSLRARC